MNIAKKFVDALKTKKGTSPYDTTAEITRIEGNTAWVHIPGGVDETPVKMTISAAVGQTVQVRVANGTAFLVGNASAPPTDDYTANIAIDTADEAKEEVTILNTVVTEQIQANNARFGEVEADTAKIHNLTANQLTASVGYIEDLTAASITAQDISSATGYIGDLTADSVTASDISAATGYIDSLTSNNVTAQNIIADHGTIGNLNSNYAHITNGVIDNAKIGHADVNGLSANYAQINAANINTAAIRNAWVDKMMVQSGLIAHEGTVYTLDAIKVNASNITAGTIDVERLIVTVDGEKYMVHVNPSTGTPSYEKLDGDVIEDLTITADKIVAGAITAEKITTENIVGSGGWINLRNGTFSYVNATSGDGISWDGTNLTINSASLISTARKSASAHFATCTTPVDTKAKDATITPTESGWTLYTGAIVTVKFTNGNTNSAPTLNINSTGAKTIRDYDATVLTADEYKWEAGATFTFVYNGTYWLMNDNSVSVRLNSAESDIQQHADEVVLKVKSTSDGKSAISAVKLTADGSTGSNLTLTADTVDIAGAAIFTSGRLSENSLDSAYDANGSASTAEANAKTYANSGIKTSVTLYYASNSTTAPAKPTAHVTTNSASTRGAWNIALPTYNASYPYLYTCTENLTIGNTYTWTSVEQSTYAAATAAIKSTADSAAPKSDAVARSQRIYYRKTASGAPNPNTTWLATSGTGYGNWSLSIPQLTSGATKYPYLYTAVQTQTVAQQAAGTACTCSAVLLDDSTTVIDGGNIITGSVTANKLNATDINASGTLTIGALSSGTQDDILNSNVEVGGRNLIQQLNPVDLSATEKRPNINGDITDGYLYTTSISNTTVVGHGVRYTAPTAVRPYIAIGRNTAKFMHGLESGEAYTISFKWKAKLYSGDTVDETPVLRLYLRYLVSGETDISYDAKTAHTFRNEDRTDRGADLDGSFEWTFTMPENIDGFFLSFAPSSTTASYFASGDYLEMTDIKLERGNKATDWTPAPEDVDTAIDDASKTATSYITTISGTSGISVHDANNTSNFVNMNSSGVNIYRSGNKVAEFGESITLGKESDIHTVINNNGFDIVKNTGASNLTFAHFGFGLGYDDEEYELTAPYYTLGIRRTTENLGIGNYSLVEGLNNIAEGSSSHAEGEDTKTTKTAAHAEGISTVAANVAAHAEGSGTSARGKASHAGGQGTIAVGQAQTAIGRYNKTETYMPDDYGQYSFHIGNGTSNQNRSDALAVDWNGNLYAAGDIYTGGADSSSGTSLTSKLNAKQNAITGGATTITSSNLTTNRALISNGSGKVAVSAVTSTELGYLDGVTSNIQTQINSSSTIAYATCSTAAATAAKVATVQGDARFVLQAGAIVGIRFTNTNTAGSPTINVNSTGAKPIQYQGTTPYTTGNWVGGQANYLNFYMYDGTSWVFMTQSQDRNTTYTNMTQAEADAGTVETGRIISAKVLTDKITNMMTSGLVDVNDSVTLTNVYAAGFLTGSQKNIQFFVPYALAGSGTYNITSLSIVTRFAEGGYGYIRSGTSGGTYTQLGSSWVSIISNGAAVRSNEISSFAVEVVPHSGFRVVLSATYAIAKASGNTAALTNNTPCTVQVQLTVNRTA